MRVESLSPVLADALDWAVQSSLAAGVLILLGVALFLAFPRVFGPRWRFAFGVIVLARLLLPFSPESEASLFNLWNTDPAPTVAIANVSPPVIEVPPVAKRISIVEESRSHSVSFEPRDLPHFSPVAPVERAVPHRSRIEIAPLLPILWLTGAAGFLGWTLVCHFRFARLLRRQGRRVTDDRLSHLFEQARQSLGIRKKIQLFAMPQLPCAAVFGWFRPRLLVAEDFAERFNDSEIRSIFLHELAHIRRHDVAWNWISHTALALHWFNPLAWFAVRRFRADREQLCDAAAIDHLSDRQRRDYGRTLITLVESFSQSAATPATVPALAPFLTRKSELKNRITMIQKNTPPIHWMLHLVAALAVAITGAVTFTSAPADDDDEREEREERRAERGDDREREGAARRGEHDDDEREHHERRGRDDERDLDGKEFGSIIEELKERIGDLAREGKHDQAHELEEHIHEMMREHPEQAKRFMAAQRHREEHAIKQEMHKLEAALKEALEEGNEAEVREIKEHMEEIHHANRRRHEDEEIHHKMRELEAAFAEAMEKGQKEKAHEIKRHMEEVHHHVRRREEGEHAERRIHHLRQAAENLEAAGLHDQAEELHHQAERLEDELREHHQEGRDDVLAGHAEHLEREVKELRHIVSELREHIDKLENELRQGRDRGERDD